MTNQAAETPECSKYLQIIMRKMSSGQSNINVPVNFPQKNEIKSFVLGYFPVQSRQYNVEYTDKQLVSKHHQIFKSQIVQLCENQDQVEENVSAVSDKTRTGQELI